MKTIYRPQEESIIDLADGSEARAKDLHLLIDRDVQMVTVTKFIGEPVGTAWRIDLLIDGPRIKVDLSELPRIREGQQMDDLFEFISDVRTMLGLFSNSLVYRVREQG